MNEPIPRTTLTEMVTRYNEVMRLTKESIEKLAEAKRLMRFTFGHYNDYLFESSIQDYELTDPKRILAGSERRILKSVWQATMSMAGIRDAMGPTDRAKLDKMLENPAELPPFDEANLLATLQGLYENQPEIHKARIFDLFKYLRPFNGYKTNEKWKVGKKIILTYAVDSWTYGYTVKGRVCSGTSDRLMDLDNTFHWLDGKGLAKRSDGSALLSAINAKMKEGETSCETDLFKCKWYYKAGSMHITFKRQDLVEKFNQIAGEAERDLPGAA